jgi:hypothetical protein
MAKKYLFLDIDGVLNSDADPKEWRAGPSHAEDPHGYGKHWHAHALVQNVKTVVEKRQLHVVLSSAWRLNWTPEDIAAIWKDHGWDYPLKDVTPDLAKCIDWDKQKNGRLRFSESFGARFPEMGKQHRGLEIEMWLFKNVPYTELATTEILILDDRSDMGRLRPWLHQTDPGKGFKDTWVEPKPLGDTLIRPSPCLVKNLLPGWVPVQ